SAASSFLLFQVPINGVQIIIEALGIGFTYLSYLGHNRILVHDSCSLTRVLQACRLWAPCALASCIQLRSYFATPHSRCEHSSRLADIPSYGRRQVQCEGRPLPLWPEGGPASSIS